MISRGSSGAGSGRRAGASGAAARRPAGRVRAARTGAAARGAPGGPRRPRYPLGVAFRTALSRRRRLIAAVLLSTAAAIAVLQLSPGRQATVPVVVAAHPLGAGTVLSHDDLRVADYPEVLAPGAVDRTRPGAPIAGAAPGDLQAVSAPDAPAAAREDPADPAADWVGRTLSSAVVQGQPLTAASVLGPDLLAGQPRGSTAVTIRVADPGTLTHLRPGQRVDLIRRDDGSAPEISPGDGSPGDDFRGDDSSGDRAPADSDPSGAPEAGSAPRERSAGDAGSSAKDTTAEDGDEGGGAAGRAGAGLAVLWVADPVEPSGGLLEPTGGVEDDLLVVAADERTAARIAASGEGELVPVLVAPAEETVRG